MYKTRICREFWSNVFAAAGFLLLISSSPGVAEDFKNSEDGIRLGYDIARRYCEKADLVWETDENDICKKAEKDLTSPVALGFYYGRWLRAAVSVEVASKSSVAYSLELAKIFQGMAEEHYKQMLIIQKLLLTLVQQGLIDPVPPFERFCAITEADCSKHPELIEKWRNRVSLAPN